jgi:hypothetical protein
MEIPDSVFKSVVSYLPSDVINWTVARVSKTFNHLGTEELERRVDDFYNDCVDQFESNSNSFQYHIIERYLPDRYMFRFLFIENRDKCWPVFPRILFEYIDKSPLKYQHYNIMTTDVKCLEVFLKMLCYEFSADESLMGYLQMLYDDERCRFFENFVGYLINRKFTKEKILTKIFKYYATRLGGIADLEAIAKLRAVFRNPDCLKSIDRDILIGLLEYKRPELNGIFSIHEQIALFPSCGTIIYELDSSLMLKLINLYLNLSSSKIIDEDDCRFKHFYIKKKGFWNGDIGWRDYQARFLCALFHEGIFLFDETVLKIKEDDPQYASNLISDGYGKEITLFKKVRTLVEFDCVYNLFKDVLNSDQFSKEKKIVIAEHYRSNGHPNLFEELFFIEEFLESATKVLKHII